MLRIVIILLTLATAAVHLSFFLEKPNSDAIYALNALGYVTLLFLLYFPIPGFSNFRLPVRYLLMAYAAVTIVAYVAFGLTTGDWTIPLGPITKLIEGVLIGSLWLEGQAPASSVKA